ncbi:Endonuclease MutS2 [Enhygromyxa salina]|uniref:Endonuclease MutS2 n=1 Tax=Enhygromyxa salina TaxID=215803 RepID=A0A2S9XNN5_9BACT|nr:DNA mismatch repair protein MutS [Enhygromyxa salina]PRP94465.1 Endonuclease MutS2 [Enhygromyxa salina]
MTLRPDQDAGAELAASSEAADPRERARALYRERARERELVVASLERQDARLSRARVACFVAFLILVVAGWQLSLPWLTLGIPVAAFVILLVIHERVLERRDAARRALAHYREGLDRCADRWAGKGATTTDHADPDHPYWADLDLFGEGSVFDLVCRARTRAGEEQLARWLTIHATQRVEPGQIRARQRSVRALIDAVDLREDLAVLGAAARVEVRPEVLIDWGRAPPLFSTKTRRWLPIAALVLPALAVAGVVAWAMGLGVWALLVVLGIEAWVYRSLGDTLARVAGPADRNSHELGVLAAVLARVERERFEDPRLVELRDALRTDDLGAGDAVAGLRRLAGWYEAQRNGLFAPIALVLMWGPNFALAIERWRRRHGPQIVAWIAALGEIEALSSLASHAFENPDDVFPEILDDAEADDPEQGQAILEGCDLGHPLLPRATCVRNDLRLCPPVRAHVISGSNMSGKSTFLRTVGTNVVLALAGAPVRASSLRLTPVRIGATLRVQDSLREGASRFWAELTRLRTVSELADAAPTLFLLDEIFHGTNSHDRRIGAEALLRSLLERGAIGLLTTHDLALAKAAEALAPAATNVHFQDDLRDGELHFDYRMREGVVRKSNALALMRSVGLDV